MSILPERIWRQSEDQFMYRETKLIIRNEQSSIGRYACAAFFVRFVLLFANRANIKKS